MNLSPSPLRAPWPRPVRQAVLLCYAFQTFGAWLLARPIATAAAASGIAGYPRGDAQLFEPGALYLLEALHREQHQLLASLNGSLLLLALWSLGSIAPEWWLLRAWCRVRAGGSRLARAPERLRQLSLFCVLTWLSRALVWSVALAAALFLRAPLVALGLGVGVQLCLSGVHDLGAARLVSSDSRVGAGLGQALRALQRSALGIAGRYAGYRLAMLGVLLGAGALASAVGTARGAALLARFSVHQLAIALLLVLRAYWLSSALAAVQTSPERAHADAFL